MNGITYIINNENKIVRKFECDYEREINNSFGKVTKEGRYHIMPKGFDPPYEEINQLTFKMKKYPKKL